MRPHAVLLAVLALTTACRRPPEVVVERSLAVDEAAYAPITGDSPLATDFFFVPKSQAQLDTYLATGPVDRPVRLIVVESAINVEGAGDLDSAVSLAKAYIDAAEPGLRTLLDGHDHLVFTVVKTPLWLSSSSNGAPLPADPGWTMAHTAPPGDLDVWAQLVRETVTHLDSKIGDEVELSFEIWNEPDLYWSGTEEELLALYATTAGAIREAVPDAKIGGFGSNQWDGRVSGSEGPVLDALVERAERDALPLDFVAFHAFVDHPFALDTATDGVQAILAAHGRQDTPVWVTEWNNTSAVRGSAFQPASFATLSTRFRERGLDMRFCATWADYSERRDGSGYGLLDHDAEDKPVARVHRRLLQLHGTQAQLVRDDEISAWIAQDGDCRNVLIWRDLPPPDVAALLVLTEELTADDLAEHYTELTALLADIRNGSPPVSAWQEVFDRARDALVSREAELTTVADVTLDLGVEGGVVRAIRMDEAREDDLVVDVTEGLVVRLDANAVGWLEVCP